MKINFFIISVIFYSTLLTPSTGLAENSIIPAELSPSDIILYRQIFNVQKSGQWEQAESIKEDIENPILFGHVEFQKLMHPTSYRSSYDELSHWLSVWGDQPDADRIFRLAMRRKPSSANDPAPPRAPQVSSEWPINFVTIKSPPPNQSYQVTRSASDARRVKNAFSHVYKHLGEGEVDLAIKDLNNGIVINTVFDKTEKAILSSKIAASAFRKGNDALALELSSKAAEVARNWVPESDWIAGLAAWNMNLFEIAKFHFEKAANSEILSPEKHAGAAFWAARANLASHNPENVISWLQESASESNTFYGQLASRQLGIELNIEFNLPVLSEIEIQSALDIKAVRRSIALGQIGENYWAEKEIRSIYNKVGIGIARPLLAVAGQYGMPSSSLYLARMLLNSAGLTFYSGLYPESPWEPLDGYTVDRALVNAFIRQESAFRTNARSVDGARGPMQLMPSTASFITNDSTLKNKNAELLYLPEKNIQIGQKYLLHLMNDNNFKDNILLVVAAYNGGPGNLNRWTNSMGLVTGPLIFIEKIPVTETRNFVSKIFSNLWIYRSLLEQKNPILDSIASNKWPIYYRLD